jgi:hypothetical protein
MSDRKQIPGKFVWFELVAKDARGAQAFYAELLGWRMQPFPMGSSAYEMIYVGDTMIGGYRAPASDAVPSHWISYVSVEDVDAAAKSVVALGGRVIDAPADMPGVGRSARIADPAGAQTCLFKSNGGDPPDAPAVPGSWLWNELHTPDPARALAFYEKVLGFASRPVDMGPTGTYHVVSRDGVDRGGVTSIMADGASPAWLPYVHVDDVDAVAVRATRLGGSVFFGPEDIPNVGRFAGVKDPTGAALAVMKPLPTEKAR